jgi:transaldolase
MKISVDRLRVKLFADGADIDSMLALYRLPHIAGFTTNPTLMRKAGISDYEAFSRKVLAAIPDRPVSLEVFADEFDEMEAQAHAIASWGRNVYVKIPVTNTRGVSAGPLIARLSGKGIALNVTAILTLDQVREVTEAVAADAPSIVSVFAGRIADTGVDPLPIMSECLRIMAIRPKSELLWASPRELLNIIQAHDIGCHIITATPDILKKLALLNKDLTTYSLETVDMFFKDAIAAGYSIRTAAAIA